MTRKNEDSRLSSMIYAVAATLVPAPPSFGMSTCPEESQPQNNEVSIAVISEQRSRRWPLASRWHPYRSS
jgi:hypothetical protein